MKRSVFALLALASTLWCAAPATAEPSGWAADRAAAVVADGVLVVHVVVPLCDNTQIDCGSTRAGDPDDLGHNLYWGAVFGHNRFFSRKASSFGLVSRSDEVTGVLERAVFRKKVAGKAFGRDAGVEVIVVLDAVRGDAIDGAVDSFYRVAERGARVTFQDGQATRTLPVDVAGYAGHNRMMDGKKPPPKLENEKGRASIPSFVLACYSNGYFREPLAERGSRALVLTDALMAPEGYVLEAVIEGLARNESRPAIRKRVVAAYAKWQGIEEKVAGPIFAKLE